jgi:hypothetical protein
VIILEDSHFRVSKEETDDRRKEIEDLTNELVEVKSNKPLSW